jgi:hypothetical protein
MKKALLLLALLATVTHAQTFQTPVQRKDLDPGATAEWVDGETNTDVQFHPRHDDPSWVVWTQQSGPGHSGINFGASEKPGVRRLRLGFKRPIPVETVFARGGGRLSVLKPDAPYPGELDNDDQWVRAERVHGGEFSLWVLPPGTTTRALRFSQEARGRMKVRFRGHLAGVYVLAERLVNLAPEAGILCSSNQDRAKYLTDHRRGGWKAVWENEWKERGNPVSEDRPESLLLLWPGEVRISGLCAPWAGFARARVETYVGPATTHPREAGPEQWETMGQYELSHQYPRRFAPNWIGFEGTVTTRAVRITITAASPTKGVHPHVDDKPREGRRVWLGELMALQDLGERPPELPGDVRRAEEKTHPPIPVRFRLEKPGYVTLVIEDEAGHRVRNLISEKRFEAGRHTVWWDGQREEAVNHRVHGIYDLRGKLVEPGTYRVRGIYRDEVRMRYELTPYSAGSPPWLTPDGKGGWLADHTPPYDALYVPEGRSGGPEILLTSFVVEHGHGLIGVDPEGNKLWGIRRLGGVWTGGSHLARDAGSEPDPEVIAYVGSWWSAGGGKGEVRLTALQRDGRQQTVLKHRMESKKKARLGGLAVRNGLLLASLPAVGKVLFVDVPGGKAVGTVKLKNPGSLAFDGEGGLLMLSGTRLLRYEVSASPPRLTDQRVVISRNLEAPRRISLAPDGKIYVSDWGESHQVKVFSAKGQPIRTIGKAGGPQFGPYDPARMHHPCGMAITPAGRLWVAERDKTPKRVSLWTPAGRFDRAFYGPPQYGGGGALDAGDGDRFYYAAGGGDPSGLGFRVDREDRSWDLTDIYYRAGETPLKIPCGHHGSPVAPQRAIRYRGRHYMTNAFNSTPTSAPTLIGVWLTQEGRARPVAVVGAARSWGLLREERFATRLPEGFDWNNRGQSRKLLFAWSDLNFDADLQPNELSFVQVDSPGVGQGYIRGDLTVTFTYTDRLSAREFTGRGVPVYRAGDVERVVHEKVPAGFTSGSRAALDTGEWIVRMGGPIRGYRDGELTWTSPNQWPGLHASHRAPTPQHPGQIIGATRLLGHPVEPRGAESGPIWAVNGNFGNVYLMTADGMFVATLGRDQRSAPPWHLLKAKPGMIIEDVSFITEHFWPTISQTPDGEIYLVAGKGHCGILRLEGLETIRQLPRQELEITPAMLRKADAYRARVQQEEIQRRGRKTLRVALRDRAPEVDGKLADWEDAHWVRIGEYVRRIETLKADAAVAVADDRLYAAYRTGSPNLLQNTGEALMTLFKTGGALDLRIGTDPKADPGRRDPVPGDLRLLVARVDGQTKAVLYRPQVPGAEPADAIPFSSPWRTVTFDQVRDVSSRVRLAGQDGNYEFSVPLRTLGLVPQKGMTISGDVGILRGSAGLTIHRLYWHNKATGVIADVPGESMLHPELWGRWEFVPDEQ